jgi:hypothetical protein
MKTPARARYGGAAQSWRWGTKLPLSGPAGALARHWNIDVVFRFVDVPFRRRDLLEKEHGERIGLLAGAAPGNPDPQRPVQGVPVDEIGYALVHQEFEGIRVAKEAGDVDQQSKRRASPIWLEACLLGERGFEPLPPGESSKPAHSRKA